MNKIFFVALLCAPINLLCAAGRECQTASGHILSTREILRLHQDAEGMITAKQRIDRENLLEQARRISDGIEAYSQAHDYRSHHYDLWGQEFAVSPIADCPELLKRSQAIFSRARDLKIEILSILGDAAKSEKAQLELDKLKDRFAQDCED